jgi:rare lipoprotein A
MKRSESLSRSGSNVAPFLAFALPALRRCSPFYLLVAAGSLGLAGCAQQPTTTMHGKEYFPSAVYGAASPRVYADGEAIPHGGGVYKTGNAYTVAGHTYYPMQGKHYSSVGMASWYGDAFHGRRTANGEIYDRDSISAAHPTMPLPSYARVTNLRNHYSIIVRVNDRGPYAPGRIMDVSRRVADLLDFRRTGTTKVRVDYVGQASLAGSDDQKLMATLRQDGQLAQLDMRHPPTYDPVQTASAEADDTVPPATASAASASATDVADNAPPPDVVFKGKIPSPPSRPFDLDTIPGADAQISASR